MYSIILIGQLPRAETELATGDLMVSKAGMNFVYMQHAFLLVTKTFIR